MNIEYVLLAIIVILAILMPIVFFREHNRNVRKMKEISEGLEKMLKPKDKIYTLLGTSLGFRALYRLDRDGIKRAEAVLLLLPRHSLVYYPISKITSRYDKLILKVEYVENLDLKPSTIERKKKFCKEGEKIRYAGKNFTMCGKDAGKLFNMLGFLRNQKDFLRISYENKILFVEFKSSSISVLNDLDSILREAAKFVISKP